MSTRDIVLAYLRAIETNQPDAASPFLHDDVLVVEHPNKIAWTGTLGAGREMRAEIVSIIELRDGKIWRQEQYDSYLA